MLIDALRCKNIAFWIMGLFGFYAASLIVAALTLSTPDFTRLFSEDGFFEQGSGILWIGTALVALLTVRRTPARSLLFFSVFILLAARENDMNRTFTRDSFFKLNYYKMPIGMEKYVAGVVAVLIVVLLLLFIYQVMRYFMRNRGLWQASGQVMVMGLGALALTKTCDRLPSILRHDGLPLPPQTLAVMKALEEGLEMSLPILFALALLITPNILTRETDRQSLPK